MNNLQTLVNISTATKSSNVVHDYSNSSPYHTSVDVKANGVYNMFEGVVWQLGNEPGNLHYVCVKSSNDCIMKYGHIDQVYAGLNVRVRPGELIGTAKKYTSVEYLTLNKSKFPIYVNEDKYYKNDPTDIVVNNISPSINSDESTYKQTKDIEVVLEGGVEYTY